MGACLLICHTEIVTDCQWVVDNFTHVIVHMVMVALKSFGPSVKFTCLTPADSAERNYQIQKRDTALIEPFPLYLYVTTLNIEVFRNNKSLCNA